MDRFLLFAHVVGAILLIGPTTVATSSFARFAAAGELGAMAAAHRNSRAYGTASVVVPGIGLAMAGRHEVLDQRWIQLAIVLFAAGGALLAFVHLPAQREALARVRAHEDVPAGLLGRLRAGAGGYSLLWVAIVWLMVAKPT
jgi:hypothetical protein